MKKFFFPILITIFTVNFTYAQAGVGNHLSFDIGGVGEAVSGLVKKITNVGSVSKDKEEKKEEEKIDDEFKKEEKNKTQMNLCEVYDMTYLNTIDLDMASTKAVERIDRIETTLEEEVLLREEIFEKDKKLTDLQKKERIIFREMKKELDEARKYYSKVDGVVTDITEMLVEFDCEGVNKKEEKILRDTYDQTDVLLTEENIFRRTFTASLKEKMLILQKGVKEGGK